MVTQNRHVILSQTSSLLSSLVIPPLHPPFGILAVSQVVLWLLMPNRFSFHSFQKFLNGQSIPGPKVFSPFRLTTLCVWGNVGPRQFFLSVVYPEHATCFIVSAVLFHKSDAACFFYTVFGLHVYCTMYEQLPKWSSCRKLIRKFCWIHCLKNPPHFGCFNVTRRDKMWDCHVMFLHYINVRRVTVSWRLHMCRLLTFFLELLLKGYSGVSLIHGLIHLTPTVLDSLSRDQVSRPLI